MTGTRSSTRSRNTPDAVIVDVRMPPTHTVEGLRAAHVIREGNPRIGIVILSQTVEAGTACRSWPSARKASAICSRTA